MKSDPLPDEHCKAFKRFEDGRAYGVVFLQHYVSRIFAVRLMPGQTSPTGYDDVW